MRIVLAKRTDTMREAGMIQFGYEKMFANVNLLLKHFMTPLIKTSLWLQHSVLTCNAPVLWPFE